VHGGDTGLGVAPVPLVEGAATGAARTGAAAAGTTAGPGSPGAGDRSVF